MSVPYADLHLQYQTIKEDIDAAIAAVIRDSAFIRGTYVDAFESAFAAAMDAKRLHAPTGPTRCLSLWPPWALKRAMKSLLPHTRGSALRP